MFALQTPLLELIARGVVLYIAILALTRVMPRRTGGELAMMDLALVLLVTEAASHAQGDYTAVAGGLVVIVVIMAMAFGMNVLSYYVPAMERLLSSPPLQVVRDGRMLRRNMRREYLTEEELMSHLRLQGIESLIA